ncbi:hypothetical protein K488DRAFT_87440 [Vararia minispora EC-137]|uniref:Uncharacterized protein n=1 Tax=Vararia minispora EC-137 TaxID=1314806 RepID=A0ACB8QGE1_9AGAM|nr:hypothetical protein K488DRAFT_87440 [Vararia minispora EC-137]
MSRAATTSAPLAAKALDRPAFRIVVGSAPAAGRRVKSRRYASLARSQTQPDKQPARIPENVARLLSSSRLENAPTLTALHTVRGLLPRIFAPDSPQYKFWDAAISQVFDDLSFTPDGAANVVVYSADEQAGGAALVHALLEDPFASEQDSLEVCQRWEGKGDLSRLDILSGPARTPSLVPPRSSEDEPYMPLPPTPDVYLNTAFFSSLPVPVRLSELRPSLHAPSPDTLRVIYTADIPIVIVNPLTKPLPSLFPTKDELNNNPLFPYPLPPHALLLIASPSPSSVPESLRNYLSTTLGIPTSNVLFIDPFRAKSAAHALRSGPSNALNVQRYHDDALGSGLSALRSVLSAGLQPDRFRVRKANAILRAAITMMYRELSHAEQEMRVAIQAVRGMRFSATKIRAEAERSILGTESVVVNTGREAALSGHIVHDVAEADKVRLALEEADKMVRPAVEQLWPRIQPSLELQSGSRDSRAFGFRTALQRLRALGRSFVPRFSFTALGSVDDVAWVVGQAVHKAWVGGVERTLLPAFSPLRPTQERIVAETLSHVASLPPSLRSSLLHNSLQQLTVNPSLPLSPSALIAPLAARLRRLDEGPTAVLGCAAQSLAVRSASSLGAGAAVTVSWLGWVHGADVLTGTDLAAVNGDVSTAVGAGLLVAVGGLRWAIGRWEKARRAWLGDWRRMLEGAERDIKVSLRRAMDEQVLAVPLRACEGVDVLLAHRQDEVDTLRKEVKKVEDAAALSVVE